jgi:hypothetical protein
LKEVKALSNMKADEDDNQNESKKDNEDEED